MVREFLILECVTIKGRNDTKSHIQRVSSFLKKILYKYLVTRFIGRTDFVPVIFRIQLAHFIT